MHLPSLPCPIPSGLEDLYQQLVQMLDHNGALGLLLRSSPKTEADAAVDVGRTRGGGGGRYSPASNHQPPTSNLQARLRDKYAEIRCREEESLKAWETLEASLRSTSGDQARRRRPPPRNSNHGGGRGLVVGSALGPLHEGRPLRLMDRALMWEMQERIAGQTGAWEAEEAKALGSRPTHGREGEAGPRCSATALSCRAMQSTLPSLIPTPLPHLLSSRPCGGPGRLPLR